MLDGNTLRINEVTKSYISFRVSYDVISDKETEFSNWDMTAMEETNEKLTEKMFLEKLITLDYWLFLCCKYSLINL